MRGPDTPIYGLVPLPVHPQISPVLSRIDRSIAVPYRLQTLFTRDTFSPGNATLESVLVAGSPGRRARALVVVDDGVARAQSPLVAAIEAWFDARRDRLELVAPPLVIGGGERVKNAYFHVSDIHERIDRLHIDRHNYVMAIGGGALLDMVGLAAATAHRGVRHIRFPATTLAQADSGVGVKNGINAFGKKNFVGTFAPPFAVINDFALLRSLGERDLRAGLSEAVKVACIRDAAFFGVLEDLAPRLAGSDLAAFEPVIQRSAELHLDHIAGGGDPFEFGSARPLDFGHWSAHKLEQLSEFRIRHGEAVAIGIALDVLYSRLAGLLDAPSSERVLALLARLGFELHANELHYSDSDHRLVLLKGLEEFREHLGGELTITLLSAIGRGVEVHDMDHTLIRRALDELRIRFGSASPSASGPEQATG